MWKGKYFFKDTLEKTEEEFPDFEFEDDGQEAPRTRRPLYLFENYDWREDIDGWEGFVNHRDIYDRSGSVAFHTTQHILSYCLLIFAMNFF